MDLIPDPTIDLKWDEGYIGCIVDIFDENAAKEPGRTCVTETKSSESPTRKFTYKQISEATNIVAHYLHKAGVEHGDVVMIWAHRSADLVVAIMGVLKGFCFSVLDPQYPPERQRIYLEVAKPKALIQLARATEEAGPLAPLVRKFIDEELDLKAVIPSLRIQDNGTISGGEVDGKDIFAGVRNLADHRPEIVIGPDSNPTLSFTSGSEGRPKGVLGRHDSLTRYFPFMAERFGLGPNDRMTMLSGIGHDPIQRDVFTPLFLGAQILVPPKEAIAHERLAEWMREYEPTVTVLTPAMGQILVGGATAEFPSLKRAFFVGDILTKRDCRILRKLAKNCSIVNMYGSTESQRAVSFFEVPSTAQDAGYLDTTLGDRDTIPAGAGMQDVQMLVVDRENRQRICKPGEVGEIYIRAAGLAEGYLDNPDLNSAKFVTSWFVPTDKWTKNRRNGNEPWRQRYKGPRDRMYRTGDLGSYLVNLPGQCDVSGRVDSQVKIRGFRIELNEIDSYLSQHQLIRDCKTLVRRDQNEEPTLVSYVVIEEQKWNEWLQRSSVKPVEDEGTVFGPVKIFLKKYQPVQDELRNFLKERLPVYAVPTIYIFLQKLPLNPNGKVDSPNLPFPDIVRQKGEASETDLERWEAMTATQRALASIWAKLIPGLNEKAIGLEQGFFDIGGHSLLAQQMIFEIKRAISISISINAVYASSTLAGLSREIEKVGQVNGTKQEDEATEGDSIYAKSFDELVKELAGTYKSADPALTRATAHPTIFLTGATGFLGCFLLRDLLQRSHRSIHLILHVRNAKDQESAMDRVKKSLQGYGLWKDEWSSRISCVIGDLAEPKLGLHDRPKVWQDLAEKVDIVIHNAAQVHWVRTYEQMKNANVRSTLDCIELCNTGKPKVLAFISSTSAIDSPYFVNLSERQLRAGEDAVLEDDDLQGARSGLQSGYGQTKWVSEQLVRVAGARGLTGVILRSGYILGDVDSGVCNTDDFLIRLWKGCVQLKARPRIINSVNAVPVNHVSRLVAAAALNPPKKGEVHVVHVTAHPRVRLNEFLSLLEAYGWTCEEVSYNDWKQLLEEYVSSGPQEQDISQMALLPLWHFVTNDLPLNSRAPELSDINAVKVLKLDAQNWTGEDESSGAGIERSTVGRYLRWLCQVDQMPWPDRKGKVLPDLVTSATQGSRLVAVGGRGGDKR